MNNSWDEKNYIEQKKNSLSSSEHAQNGFTSDTKPDSTKSAWSATGSLNQMYKLCYNGETGEFFGSDESHVIYLWTEKRGGVEYPCYVGQTVNTLSTRINEHLNHPTEYLFQRKLRKRTHLFKCYILHTGGDQNTLDGKETEYILHFNTFHNNNRYGYNLTLGGRGGKKSDVVKQKLSKKLLGRKFSQESIDKMSKSHVGKSPANKGKSPSEFTRKIWSAQRKGKKQTDDTIKKRSISLLNKKPVGRTGLRGVTLQKSTGKYLAFANKQYLGTYLTPEEASSVVKENLKYKL